jgi:glycosyltransferase involved in cell wall biosynthesis
MKALATMSPAAMKEEAQAPAAGPCVAVVTPCKATYFKPLYEAFANAQPKPWRTVMVWPGSHDSEHPEELITPVADNLEIRRVDSQKIIPSQNPLLNPNWRERRRRFLPSREMWQTLSALAPRMVMIQEYSPFALAGLLYAKRHGLPVVTLTEVGQRNQGFFRPHVRLWHALWSSLVNGIVAACPTSHVPVTGRKLPSIAAYHAVDSRVYLPKPASSHGGIPVFVFIGQLIPRKGLDLWMSAAKVLKARGHAAFKMRIIGGGDDAWVRGLVSEAGLDEQVEWSGFLSGEALREAIRSADIFVLPTRQDTYAVVVHEAACLGLPLIISKHAGAAEAVVREDINGFVIDPANAEQFADKMESLLAVEVRERMSRESRATGEAMSAHQRGAALWRWMYATFLTKA